MQKFISSIIAVMVFGLFGLFGCGTKQDSHASPQSNASSTTERPSGNKVVVPGWAKNATMYELNIRQFTPEGTFRAVVPHLERLARMGVDIIWLMPIHPISETKRKGGLGSYYAVDGFREVNPEYGNEHDLQYLISTAHNNGMKVIIDWVPHHTGWDHPWITEHPEWYSHDKKAISSTLSMKILVSLGAGLMWPNSICQTRKCAKKSYLT